jgi:hypothetical protein
VLNEFNPNLNKDDLRLNMVKQIHQSTRGLRRLLFVELVLQLLLNMLAACLFESPEEFNTDPLDERNLLQNIVN